MPLDPIDVSGIIAEVQRAETLEASAAALIAGFAASVSAAVKTALEADQAANAATVKAALDAIEAEKAKLTASSDALGAAITANTPSA